ncbi:MAG: GNAT family protein [bacterium]
MNSIKSTKIYLKKALLDDIPYIMNSERDKNNCEYVSQWSEQQHIEAISSHDKEEFIVYDNNNEKVGFIILCNISNINKSILIQRIVINKKNKGYGREVLGLIKKLCFIEYKTHRLWLDVKDHNFKAKNLYESEGFITEGLLRESSKESDGSFCSQYIMSIIDREYLSNL